MELGLSLGDSSRPFVGFMEKPHREASNQLGLGFNTSLSIGPIITSTRQRDQQQQQQQQEAQREQEEEEEEEEAKPNKATNNNPVIHQLDLLPQLSLPWHPSENGSSFSGELGGSSKGLDVNVLPLVAAAAAAAEDEAEEGAALSSSPNSAASSFQMDLCIFRGGSRSGGSGGGGGGGGGGGSFSGSGGNYYNYGGKRDSDGDAYYDHQRDSSRASDDDDNGGGGGGSTRKKLRLSKEQSAYLEESFKEHNTLNPKQKLALAKQLNLRPRQVEVWFQNRRARTKLKQTEVDCEYLKRCCETLTEENRRLHKELQELRALKTSNPFYMQLPATTLTMCPSCERVATNSNSNNSSSTAPNSGATNINANTGGAMMMATATTAKSINDSSTAPKAVGFPLGKPRFHPFAHTTTTQPHPHQSTAS